MIHQPSRSPIFSVKFPLTSIVNLSRKPFIQLSFVQASWVTSISLRFSSISLVHRPDSGCNLSVAFRISDDRIRRSTHFGHAHKYSIAACMAMSRIFFCERAARMYPSSFGGLFLVLVHIGDHFCLHTLCPYTDIYWSPMRPIIWDGTISGCGITRGLPREDTC
jgi:hypothetical protein